MDWIAAVVGPAVVGIFAVLAWIIRIKSEEIRNIQEKLREERRKIYVEVVEPYIMAFAGARKSSVLDKAIEKVKSVNYKKTIIELDLLGSDKRREWIPEYVNSMGKIITRNEEKLRKHGY